jgi:hypothetical protein
MAYFASLIRPTMQRLDLLVGCVAAIFGLALLVGAAVDGSWLMSLAKARRLVDAIGKTAARLVLAALGLGLMAIGAMIASGWRVNW